MSTPGGRSLDVSNRRTALRLGAGLVAVFLVSTTLGINMGVLGVVAAFGLGTALGERVPVEGETVTAKLYRSGRPERVDDYAAVGSELAERLRASVEVEEILFEGRRVPVTVSLGAAIAIPRRNERELAGRDLAKWVGQIGLIESRAGSKAFSQLYAALALRHFGRDLQLGGLDRGLALLAEQTLARPDIDHRVDMFAFGVTALGDISRQVMDPNLTPFVGRQRPTD